MKASVIIPTKNPGDQFFAVLESVISQKTPWEYEILVIDSGSTDGTVNYVLSKKEVKLLNIPPEEFGHGKTRNLGAEKSTGEFIVYITHDALPANQNWLFNLVEACDVSNDIGGAFGRHIAYDDASPFTKRDLKLHFDNLLMSGSVLRLEDLSRYEIDPGYRQLLHFFSSNNACLRRSVWEKIPLPDVDFAEDQIWAKTIIEAGYSKAYADNAIVYHSHDFGPWETGRRSFDESYAFKRYFGYNLCPGFIHLVVQIFRTSINDISYAVNQRFLLKEPKWLLVIPLKNLFRQFGLFLGGNNLILPSWFVQWYSRDKSLFRNG